MTEQELSIQADQVVIESREGAYIVAFSAGTDPDPDRYVILQRSMEESGEANHDLGHDTYFLEVGGFRSGYGGITKATLSTSNVFLQLRQPSKHFGSVTMINISYRLASDEKARLENQLRRIFMNTDCNFIVIVGES